MADVFLCWFALKRHTRERRHRDKGMKGRKWLRDEDMKEIIPC
jgi:hypothetical protein